MAVADVMQMIADNDIKFVDFRFTDTLGKEQHVTVPVSAFDEDKFTDGHAFDGSSIASRVGFIIVGFLKPASCASDARARPWRSRDCGRQ